MTDRAELRMVSGELTIRLPGLTAVRIDTGRRVIAVDYTSGSDTTGREWLVADLRSGTYGGFHRLKPADECFDVHCANSGEHITEHADDVSIKER